MSSWMCSFGRCVDCGYEIVVTQGRPMPDGKDYRWYCSNLECKNHTNVEETHDDETPTFLQHLLPFEL